MRVGRLGKCSCLLIELDVFRCESAYKYQTLPFVAEFANTMTNLPIMVLPMLNAFMLRDYINQVNSLIFLPHLLLTINGLASTAYHATLSLFGQLVDELSILWLINICVLAYLPIMSCCPENLKRQM
jgi:alkaline ceramidase